MRDVSVYVIDPVNYVGMKAHNELAILHHSYNTQCKQATTKDSTKISKLYMYIQYVVLLKEKPGTW